MHRFVKLLIERRLSRASEDEFEGEPLNQWLRESKKSWHGVILNKPDWSKWSHSVALRAEFVKERRIFHWILNAYWGPLQFELPEAGGAWRRWIDTALESPEDIVQWQEAPPIEGRAYLVSPHSVVVLYAPISA